MDNLIYGLARGLAYVAREEKSFGIDLGYNICFVATSSKLNTESEFLFFPLVNIVLGCFPNLTLPLPPSIKYLIGRKFSDLKLQSPNFLIGSEISMSEGLDGFPVFHERNNQPITLSQLLSKSLSCLYRKPVIHANVERIGCAIGVPIYFTDSQRIIVLDAAKNAGLHNPTLFHETTASALSYARGCHGTTFFSQTENIYVIIDMGATGMQVCIVKLTQNKLRVLSHAFDNSLGGKAFDVVLHNFFIGEFEKLGYDVTKNPQFYWKLYFDCERMKIELDSRYEAFFQFPWNNQVMIRSIKRAEFESMCTPLLERVKQPLERALSDAGLSVKNIHSVKNVGFGSRIPAIMKILTDFFGKQPDQVTTKKLDVVVGCAELGTGRIQVQDIFPHSIAMSWNTTNVTIEGQAIGQAIVFPSGTPMNTIKEVIFYGSATFFVNFMYAHIGDSNIPTRIGKFKIGPFQSSTGEKVSGKFEVKLDRNGIVCVESVFISENEKEVRLEVSRLNESQEQHEDMLEAKRLTEEANKEMELLNISKQVIISEMDTSAEILPSEQPTLIMIQNVSHDCEDSEPSVVGGSVFYDCED